MSHPPFHSRLAVCSWSLQPQTPEELIAALQRIGLPRVQIALDPIRAHPEVWGTFPNLCARHGIQIVSGMLTTVGEDYSSMETIRRTGGLVPDATWDENWRNFQASAGLAESMNIGLITFHAGFLPHDDRDPQFAKLADRLCRVADLFASKGIDLALETGQESAAALLDFLGKLNRSNLGVNFDPANMILYDKGNPIEALRTLAPWLKQCHIKDANKTTQPGVWGEEVATGSGQVDWTAFFRALKDVSFGGYLAIEREAGNQRLQDIQSARAFVEQTLKALQAQ